MRLRQFASIALVWIFERADGSFGDGQVFAGFIESGVSFLILRFEQRIGFAGLPDVQCQVGSKAGEIAKQASLLVVRVASKKLGPAAGGAVYGCKTALAARLDFELPED